MPKVRSVFLSDIHLGTRACQADRLLDFLREHPAEQTYLVGDIIDFWAMSRSISWSQAQNTVVQKLLRRARHGERVVFIPGNHDEALRDYCGIVFGDVEVVDEMVHETADGRRFLLIHGDQFDQVTRHHRWVAVLGDKAYETAGPHQCLAVLGAAQAGHIRLLVAGRLRQAQGQDGAQFHFRFRGIGHPPRPRARPGWRDLRPYPLGADPRHWRPDLRQLWRLGRFLHRHRRTLRWRTGAGFLGQHAAATPTGRAAGRRQPAACAVPVAARMGETMEV